MSNPTFGGAPYTEEEDAQIIAGRKAKITVAQLAERMGRSFLSVRARWRLLKNASNPAAIDGENQQESSLARERTTDRWAEIMAKAHPEYAARGVCREHGTERARPIGAAVAARSSGAMWDF
jgi:hypothetical protein